MKGQLPPPGYKEQVDTIQLEANEVYCMLWTGILRFADTNSELCVNAGQEVISNVKGTATLTRWVPV